MSPSCLFDGRTLAEILPDSFYRFSGAPGGKNMTVLVSGLTHEARYQTDGGIQTDRFDPDNPRLADPEAEKVFQEGKAILERAGHPLTFTNPLVDWVNRVQAQEALPPEGLQKGTAVAILYDWGNYRHLFAGELTRDIGRYESFFSTRHSASGFFYTSGEKRLSRAPDGLQELEVEMRFVPIPLESLQWLNRIASVIESPHPHLREGGKRYAESVRDLRWRSSLKAEVEQDPFGLDNDCLGGVFL